MKIVIDATLPGTAGKATGGRGSEPLNPVNEITEFLKARANEIRKAYNGNEPGEFTGTTTGGVVINAMVITEEMANMNGGTVNQGKSIPAGV